MKAAYQNKTVLVTGGAVRIGREICLAFAREGARVIVHCNRSEAAAADLLAELPPNTEPHLRIVGDLTCPTFRHSLIAGLVKRGICLDCLVNNASTYRRAPLKFLGEDQLRQDFEINFIVPLLLMKDFAQLYGAGNIINLVDQRVTSIEKNVGAYGLAKKGLKDATEAAALEWAPDIRVNAVAPGYSLPPPGVAEEKMKPLLANIPLRRPSPPAQIAAACIFLATAEAITGQTIFVDGGMHLTSPGQAEKEQADYTGA